MPLAISAPQLVADDVVLAAAALLVAGVAAAGLAARLRVPSLVLVLGLGMLVADDGLEWITFDDAALAQNLAVVALVLILYDGGLSTGTGALRRVAAPAASLATVGVVVTMAVVAGSLVALTDVDASTAWIIGAVVASTDAAAVFVAMRSVDVRRRLTATLEAESGLNDPIAVLLTIGTIEMALGDVTSADWLVFGARQLVLGLVVGVAVGAAGGRLVHRARLASPGLQPVLALAVGAAAYGVAAALGGSSFLAVYLAGVAVSAAAPGQRRAIRQFHQGLAEAAQIGLFFLLGVLVFPSELLDDLDVGLVATAVLVLVARPVAVVVAAVWFRFRPRELAFLSWAGLRGAVPIVLATYPLTGGVEDGRLVFDVVFVVVLVSTVVQGTSLGAVARRLGLVRERTVGSVAVDVAPLGTAGVDVAEVELDEGHPFVGRRLADVAPPPPVRVALVGRAGAVFVPGGDTRLEAGDVLVVGVTAGTLDLEVVRAWAACGASA